MTTVPNKPGPIVRQGQRVATSLEFSWSRPNGYLDYYLVNYVPNFGQPPNPVTVEDTTEGNPSLTLTNLLDNTDYTINVVAVAGEGATKTTSDQRTMTFRTGRCMSRKICVSTHQTLAGRLNFEFL